MPLGEAYLELIAVVDEQRAAASAFGSWVARSRPGAPMGWAARARMADVTGRLGLEPTKGARRRQDGRLLEWQLAGVEQARAEPSLPFFIEWSGDELPGHAHASHGRSRIAELDLSGDADRVHEWLGPHDIPLVVEPGPPAVMAVVLELPDGSRFSVP